MSNTAFQIREGLNYPSPGGYNLASASFSDSVDLARFARRFVSDTAGSIKVTTVNGDTLTIPVLVGVMVDVSVRRVWATGSTPSTLTMLI